MKAKKMNKPLLRRRPAKPSDEQRRRFSLTLFFTIVVFCVLLAAVGLAATAVYVFSEIGVIGGMDEEFSLSTILISMGIISIFIGAVLSLLLAKFPLTPFHELINRINRLAAGDFKTRISFGKGLSAHPTFREISDSFNKLAEELEHTELLRSDFVNNFSHEFKTPIVSIAGLAKLVNKGNLSPEQHAQYLTAIEEESMRLAAMATNVLYLTKVENQAILSDVSRFNLSEQIRSSVLLLENKWTAKEIELSLDFDEYTIEANEEMLKEVWINLVDNAIKFSPVRATVSIEVAKTERSVSVAITNTGSEIREEDVQKIWNKFYQSDHSHATQGNGVGLAIVRRIVELHGGKAKVESHNGAVTFTISLPLRQGNSTRTK